MTERERSLDRLIRFCRAEVKNPERTHKGQQIAWRLLRLYRRQRRA